MEMDTEQLINSTQENLQKLIKETEEKSKYEMERITLEKQKISEQQALKEREDLHNQRLADLTKMLQDLSNATFSTLPTIQALQVKLNSIWNIQEILVNFLIQEYQKLGDKKNEETIKTLKESLKTVADAVGKSVSEVKVIGNVTSQNDVNISSKDNSL